MSDLLKSIQGRTKAAILLGVLPPETSQKIVSQLEQIEREILAKEIMDMPSFDQEVLDAVIEDYLGFMREGDNGRIRRGEEFLTEIFDGAMPEDEFNEMKTRIKGASRSPLQTLLKVKDVGSVLAFVQNEDPQTIAVIASHMRPVMAADLLSHLPEDKMAEVAMGIATMEQTNRDVLIRIENHLNKKLHNLITSDSKQTDGIKTLVGILNNVNRATEKSLFERLDRMDSPLSERIKSNMFVFEDILKLDRVSLQRVVNKITDNELIAKSLKLASEELREKFYSAMSAGRKQYVDDANEGLGRVRVSDAEEAQAEIANIVKEMEKNNEIIISRGEDDVIL